MDFHTANLRSTYLRLYRMTKETRWLEIARAAGNTLTQYQLDDGSTMTWMCDRTFGISAHYCGTSGTHNFWPAAWAMSAAAWAELAEENK